MAVMSMYFVCNIEYDAKHKLLMSFIEFVLTGKHVQLTELMNLSVLNFIIVDACDVHVLLVPVSDYVNASARPINVYLLWETCTSPIITDVDHVSCPAMLTICCVVL